MCVRRSLAGRRDGRLLVDAFAGHRGDDFPAVEAAVLDEDIAGIEAAHNDARVGIYAEVVRGGSVQRGDVVRFE